MNKRFSTAALLISIGLLSACATTPATKSAADAKSTAPKPDVTLPWKIDADAYRSTYVPPVSKPVVIRNATILTGTGQRIDRGSILLRDGLIAEVGTNVQAPPDATMIDAAGKWVTPGIIDAHSHLGVYASPEVQGLADGNEATDPNTAEVWAEHSVWPQDPQFPLALAGGVTSMQILPGSANLFGGRGVTVKNVRARDVYGMKFPGAPYGLKMACGENPLRVYGERKRSPSTRMGNVAGYRAAWAKADKYRRDWKEYVRKAEAGEKDAKRPDRDLKLDTLAAVLEGDVLVQNHCYRADEMVTMIDISKEFGFHVAAFHHAVEAYKIADVLTKNNTCANVWADWWGFKMEAFDGIPEQVALIQQAGGRPIIKSDSAISMQRLNQEAAKAMYSGRAAGIDISEDQALRWVTANPAWALGIDPVVGTLEKGKRADVVVWSAHPFSVYARADAVIQGGEITYRREVGLVPTDFEAGNSALGDTGGAR
jgi:imidazolonepropionase-like amidohydrolase